jgi:hypothetical protein
MTRREKYLGGNDSTRRRSTRRPPPDKLISHEENCQLLGISPDEEFPNKEYMVEAHEV